MKNNEWLLDLNFFAHSEPPDKKCDGFFRQSLCGRRVYEMPYKP